MHIGIVDFSINTLLFIASRQSLFGLISKINSRNPFDLACISNTDISRLYFVPVAVEEDRLFINNNFIVWQISNDESKNLCAKIEQLAVSSYPAHIYCEEFRNETNLVIMISVDEYDVSNIFNINVVV